MLSTDEIIDEIPPSSRNTAFSDVRFALLVLKRAAETYTPHNLNDVIELLAPAPVASLSYEELERLMEVVRLVENAVVQRLTGVLSNKPAASPD